MALSAAEIGIRTETRPSIPRIFGTAGAALIAVLRRSDERRSLGSSLAAAEVGRQTGVRC